MPHDAFCGLPGAGKDTWREIHRPDLPYVSLDELRDELKVSPTDNQGVVVQHAKDQCRQYLRDKIDFGLSATNVTRQVRQLWIDVGVSYNARIEIVYVEPQLPEIIEQNSSRTGKTLYQLT